MAVTWPAKNNYATGDVLTAANMNAIGDDLNDLYAGNQGGATKAAGKNAVLNSDFSVWQRGTSIAVAASTVAYTADRLSVSTAANQATTVSRQATGDTTNLPNIQYCARIQRNSGQTGTGTMYIGNSFETINSIPFTGKTVTVSFYARKGADYSATSNALSLYLWNGTGTDQNVNTGYTGANVVGSVAATLTTTWQRFSFTGTVPTNSTELALQFQSVPTGTAGTNDYFEITGVQLEQNATATPFARNASTYQGELAACQRYYQRLNAATTFSVFSTGIGAASTTSAYPTIPLKVSMRIVPTSIDIGTLAFSDWVNAVINITSATINSASTTENLILSGNVASGLTQFRPYVLGSQSSSSYLGINAEL